MSSILSRVAAVGIVAGGFALTGDLGRLATRGLDVINSSDVPPTPPPTPAPAPAPAHFEPAAGAAVAAEPVAAPMNGPPTGHAVVAKQAWFHPPRGGLEQVDVASVAAGGRIIVWIAAPRRAATGHGRCLVFDIVDPATAEALVYEAVSVKADGSPQATAAPPRRVRLRGTGPGGAVVKGGMVDVEQRGIASEEAWTERLGPVAALDLGR